MMKKSGIPLNQILGRTPEVAAQPANVVTSAPIVPAPVNTRKPRTRAATPTQAVKNPARDALKPLYVLIPQDLHRKVKAKVSLEGKSLGGLVEELLEEWVTAR
jgi:hypothetical protein